MNPSKIKTVKEGGYTVTFVGEPDPWKLGEVLAAIAGKRYGAEVTLKNVIRKEDGSRVPRSR